MKPDGSIVWRRLSRSLVVFAALYAAQLAIVGVWNLFPLLSVSVPRDVGVISYRVVRGFTWPGNIIPVIGALPLLMGQPVYVTITDSRTGTQTTVSDDTLSDIYWRYDDIQLARPELLRQ